MPLFGTGGLADRVWSGPAITVIGIDVPSVDGAVNAVSPYARARLNVRVHPAQSAAEAQAAVIRHLEAARPFGVPLTVTGGLPFAGGAGSNYMLHSIAAMLDVLRDDPGSLGLVTGVGMHMTKHVVGLYSTAPPPAGAVAPSEAMPAPATLPITGTCTGDATVAAYTVAHGRDFSDVSPLKGVVLGGGRHTVKVGVDVQRLGD